MQGIALPELITWCLLLGAMLMLIIVCATEYVRHRARWSLESGAYILALGLVSLCMSGVAQEWFGREYAGQIALMLGLTPPLSMALGTLGMRNWLRTRGREQFADITLVVCFVLCCAMVVWSLLFPPPVDGVGNPIVPPVWTQPAHATLALSWGVTWFGVIASTFASLRVALHGDNRAWLMFAACLLNAPVPLILSLKIFFDYHVFAAWVLPAMVMQGVAAWLILRNAWERHRIVFNANRILEDNRGIDPVTRLPHGGALVSQMEQAYTRAHKLLRHRPVVVAVQLFNADDILKESGENGWNQVVLATLARIRRVVSPADLVGRYYGGCFVIQINSRVTPQYLRGLGLRLASSARRPVTPRTPPSGFESDEPIETDVGVGLFWCDEVGDLTMALHEAERAATVAQGLRSRAAVVLKPRGEALAVERALGESKLKNSLRERLARGFRRGPLRKASPSTVGDATQPLARAVPTAGQATDYAPTQNLAP
jgi:GGDEF domain-containing protein